jgi:hypothetical protein
MSTTRARPKARVLIVGAGAVGQVYGLAQQLGGAHVGVLVRERHRAAAEAGYSLWEAGSGKGPTRFVPDEILTSHDEVAPDAWDELWLCMSATALWRGDWLGPLVARTGAAAIVSLQPGLAIRAQLLEIVPEERLIQGLIAFSAWHGPLPGDKGPDALWWWLPPLQSNVFAGAWERTKATAKRLRRGGLAAQATSLETVIGRMENGNAILLNLVVALEISGWSFAALRSGPWAARAASAGRESLLIAASHRGTSAPIARHLLRGWTVGLLTRLAPLVTPFHFERFLDSHFTKVGDQSRASMRHHRDEGQRRGLPTGAIEALIAGLDAVDADET